MSQVPGLCMNGCEMMVNAPNSTGICDSCFDAMQAEWAEEDARDQLGIARDTAVIHACAQEAAWRAQRQKPAIAYVAALEQRRAARRLTPLLAGLAIVTIGLISAAFLPL